MFATIKRFFGITPKPSGSPAVSSSLLRYPRIAKPSDLNQYYIKPAYLRYQTKANKHHKGKNHG